MSAVHAALLQRYPREEYALLSEVHDAVGAGGRHVDFMALNLWRSRGLELEGFEVKSDRRDWLREKKDPSKAEALAKFCDRFWLLVTGPGIVRVDEIPPPWGLLELKDGKLSQLIKAPKLEPQTRPWAFTAELVRRAQEEAKHAEGGLRSALREELRKEMESAHQERERLAEARGRQRYDHLAEKVAEFQRASGVDIEREWRFGEIGEAVKFVTSGGLKKAEAELRGLQSRAREISDRIDAVLAPSAKTEAA